MLLYLSYLILELLSLQLEVLHKLLHPLFFLFSLLL
jgi:hypothetical protein